MWAAFVHYVAVIFVAAQFYFNLECISNAAGERGRADEPRREIQHLAGLVLARGGSKGIPKKNLAKVNGKTLLGRSLDAVVESGVFRSIWVSTDDEEISQWVITNGYLEKEVALHNRSAYTATATATSISAVIEFLSRHPEIDAIGLVQTTSPFLKSEYLKEAAFLLLYGKNGRKYDSVFSVTKSHQLRWSAADDPTAPINFNPRSRPRRQDWAGEVVENGMFYFVFRHIVMNHQILQTENSAYVEIPKHLSIEVDTFKDLEIARCIAAKEDT